MNWEKSPKEGSRKKEREGKKDSCILCTHPLRGHLQLGAMAKRIRYLHQTDAWCCVTASLSHHSRHPASVRFECVCVHFFPILIHFKLCRQQWDARLDVNAYLMLQMLPLLMRSPLCVTAGWALRSSSRGLWSRATAGDSIPFWNGKRWVNPTHSCDETAIHLRLYCTSNKTFPFTVLM